MDGHFLHGTWTFSTSRTSAKARHLARRPAVSVAHVDGEALAVFSHGRVRGAERRRAGRGRRALDGALRFVAAVVGRRGDVAARADLDGGLRVPARSAARGSWSHDLNRNNLRWRVVASSREPALLAADPARYDVPQPRVGVADVPVLLDRRTSHRLAPGPPRCPRPRRGRAGDDGGDRGGPGGPHLAAGRRDLERRAGGGLRADRRLRPRPGRRTRHPARARRPQGVDPRTLARTRLRPDRRGRLGDGRSVGGRVRRLARAAGADQRRADRDAGTMGASPRAGHSRPDSRSPRSTRPTVTCSTSSSRR